MTLDRGGARPARVVGVHISGDTAKRYQSTELRLDFLVAIARAIRQRGWTDLDAIVLPAGYLRTDHWLAPISSEARRNLIGSSDLSSGCCFAASRIAQSSPGCVFVVGIDTNRRRSLGFRGDQALAAFNADGCLTVVRKIYPTDGDTNEWGRAPYLLDYADAASQARFLPLPSGRSAMLCLCYDSFVFSELALGPTHKLRHMRFRTDPSHGWDYLAPDDAWQWMGALRRQIAVHGPTVVLNPIHGFAREGSDVFWQRHGLAVASSATGGGLAIGAAHYRHGLPSPTHSMLSAIDAPAGQIGMGAFRRAHPATVVDSFTLRAAGHRSTRALIQLYQG